MQRQITRCVSTRSVPVFCSFLLVLFAVSGWACKCTPITLEEDFKASEVVFSGKVLQKGERGDDPSTADLIRFKFEVVEIWKDKSESDADESETSEKSSEIEVFTSPYTPSCGYPFKDGETYLVFADSSRARSEGDQESQARLLTTSWCSANQPLHDSFVTIALLDHLEELRSEFQEENDKESEELEDAHKPS